MALRVISTKLTEEEHGRITQICNETGCTLSSLLKQCVMDWVDKEANKIQKPLEETKDAPLFSLNNEKPVQETKIAAKIRYQYF